MPHITESSIQSFQKIGLQLIELIPLECRDKCSKWQKRGMQLQAIAAKLEQKNTPKTQGTAQYLVGRVSRKLKEYSREVESESLKQIKKEIKCLSREIAQDPLPEGVTSDGKIYIISQELLEGDPKIFWKVIIELINSSGLKPFPQIKIGNFIYGSIELLERYEKVPLRELATSLKCYLKRKEEKELSIAEARILMGHTADYRMPHELDLSHVDPVYWDAICAVLIKGVNWEALRSDQLVHLRAFLVDCLSKGLWQYPSGLLSGLLTEEGRLRRSMVYQIEQQLTSIADSTILTISVGSLSLPEGQFRIEMKELLNRYDKAEFVHILFDYKNNGEFKNRFTDSEPRKDCLGSEVTYQLHRKDFLHLLDDPEIDPTFKEERKNDAICRFRNDFEEAISLLEMRILLGISPRDKLPESLDMTEIPRSYFPFLLKMAWNPMASLSSINRGECRSNPVKHDQIHFLALFLAKHRPAEYAKFVEKGSPDTYIDREGWLTDRSFGDSIRCVSVSKFFFQLSRADLDDFLLKAPPFEEMILGPHWRIKKDLLDHLVSDPQFRPADLSNRLTVVLMDGLLHRVPMGFYYEVLGVFLRQKDSRQLPDGSLKPVDLRTITPKAFHDAVYWFKYGEMRSLAFERIQAMTLFLQGWSPDSFCTLAAQQYLLNIEVIPMADYSSWDEIEDWIAPYAEAAPKQTVQVGENGPLYTRSFIHQLAKEKKVPLTLLDKFFHVRLLDESTHEMGLQSFYFFWDRFKVMFDPANSDAFASNENPLAVALSPDQFRQIQTFVRNPYCSEYTVADLLSFRGFFTADADYSQIIDDYLANTRSAKIQADWTKSDVWNSIKEQLEQVPCVKEPVIEGVAYYYDRKLIEAFIHHGTITQFDLNEIEEVRFSDFRSDERRAHLKLLFKESEWPSLNEVISWRRWSRVIPELFNYKLDMTCLRIKLSDTVLIPWRTSLKTLTISTIQLTSLNDFELFPNLTAITIYWGKGTNLEEFRSVDELRSKVRLTLRDWPPEPPKNVPLIDPPPELPKNVPLINTPPKRAEPKSAKYVCIGLIAGAAIALVGVAWRTRAVHRIFAATTSENGFGPTRVHRVWSFIMQKTKSIFVPVHTAIEVLFGLSGTAV